MLRPEGKPVARFETDIILMEVHDNPPRLYWTDGPREGIDIYDTVDDAVSTMQEQEQSDRWR